MSTGGDDRNNSRWYLGLSEREPTDDPQENNRVPTKAATTTGRESVPVLALDDDAPALNEPYDQERSVAASKRGKEKKSKKSKKKKDDKGAALIEEEEVRPDDKAYEAIVRESQDPEEFESRKKKTTKQLEEERRKKKKRTARQALKMPIKFVIETLQTKVDETELTKELLIYIPFLVAFIFLFMTGASTEQAYWARAQLGGQLTGGQFPTLESYGWELHPRQVEAYHVSTTLQEVRNPQDWHMWFQSIVVDFWWDLPDENDAAIANSWVQGSNMKFGAMRLRTLRMRDDSCDYNEEVDAWNYTLGGGNAGGELRESRKCYGKFNPARLNESTYGSASNPNLLRFIDCKATSRQDLFGFVDNYPCVGNAVEFPTMLSRKQALAIAEQLRGAPGFNLGTLSDDDVRDGYEYTDLLFHPFATRAVILEFFSYMPFIDQFQAFKVLTEITAGGRFVHFMQVNTFQIWSLARAVDYVTTIYFFIFYIFVFYYVAKFIAACVSGFASGRLLEFVTVFWNFWDFVNLLVFLCVAVCRLAWIRASEEVHDAQLLASTSYDDQLDFIALLFNLQLWLNAINTVISFLKILKFIELNPTLNIVTRSLASAQQSLVGVLVIFVIVILSYGITGVAIFSNGLEDFRDLPTSMSTLMRMLIGDFDYIALRDENRFAAPLFFWSFMILGLFLILNFLIGIILEAFEDESDTTRAEPIPVLVARFWKRIRAGLRRFWKDPKAFMTERRDRHESPFSADGTRLTVVIEQLKQYRLLKVAEKYSLAELEQLSDADIERLVEKEEEESEEQINRHDFPRLFKAVDPEDFEERLSWVSDIYLDDLWELCVRNYHVHRLGDEDADREELQVALEQAAEDALAFVVGIGRGRGTDAARKDAGGRAGEIGKDGDDDDDEFADFNVARSSVEKRAHAEKERRENLMAVQQLFRPSEEMRNRVRNIEQALDDARDESVSILRAVLREEPVVGAEVKADAGKPAGEKKSTIANIAEAFRRLRDAEEQARATAVSSLAASPEARRASAAFA